MRLGYQCLLWLHPPAFRRQFGGEMLWIFDQAAGSPGALALLSDGLGSLARQWLLRSGWWRIALALALACVQVLLGGFGMLLFGHRQFARPMAVAAAAEPMEFAHYGSIARQPLTLWTVMYLSVFVVAGLTVMVIGLTTWQKHMAARRTALQRVR